jgi:hypothetical protein
MLSGCEPLNEDGMHGEKASRTMRRLPFCTGDGDRLFNDRVYGVEPLHALARTACHRARQRLEARGLSSAVGCAGFAECRRYRSSRLALPPESFAMQHERGADDANAAGGTSATLQASS